MESARKLIARKCTDTDLVFVHDLSFSNMKEYVDRYWGGWKEELFWKDVYKDNITIIEQGGKPVGFFDVVAEGDAMRLRNIQVAQGLQGQGIGKYMMNKVFEVAQGLKVVKIILRVFVDNPAVSFYKRLGFCTIEKDGDSLIMGKVLIYK